MAWELGYTKATGKQNGGAKAAFQITIYDKRLDKSHRSPQDIQKAVKGIGGVIYTSGTNYVEAFIEEANKHIGENGDWTWKNSGVCTKPNAWCAGFVTAVAKKVGVLDKVIYGNQLAAQIVRQGVKKGYGTFDEGPYHGKTAKPLAGDLVIFHYNHALTAPQGDIYDCNHIGIVTKVAKDGKTFTLVDGNNGGVVKQSSQSVSKSSIVGFYHPNWESVGGTPLPGSGQGTYGPLFAVENTREDAIVREVGYLNKSNEPSIKLSDIKLSIINYTSLLGDVFDIVREHMQVEFENYDENDPNNGGSDKSWDTSSNPSSGDVLALTYPCPAYKTITTGWLGYDGHHGVDFSTGGNINQKVVAAESGTVVQARIIYCQSNGHCGRKYHGDGLCSYGRYIVIKHDKKTSSGKTVYTLYAHNKSLRFSEADEGKAHVERGEQIAWSGTSGNSSGPHVHFEVRLGSNSYSSAVNPTYYLPKG